MAINFPNSPANGATHTAGGTTFTYDATAGVWNPAAASDAAITTDGSTPSLASGITAAEVRTLIGAGTTVARTAVYANIAALPTSGTAGDMAYVTATNRLYLWTGTGWYNIALINNNPTISGVNATYNLAIDGAATTVTITATDPEGLPITYSIASDTSGNTATVVQGTGASTNVFTITPSTNTAHAGTFSLTFRASDGVNIASAAASFTLQFNVQNQKYTTALITSVGANNATNQSFDDKSTSNHTILAGGEAHQTTFSPYRHGGHSVYLGGGGSLGVGVGSYSLDWSNGQTWTIEFWMKRQGRNPDGHIFMKYPGSGSNISGIRAYVSGSEGRIGLHYNSGTELTTAGTRANIADGDWHHVAVTRGSGYFKIWVDGQLDATVSNSDADGLASSSSWAIGRHGSGTASAYLKDTLIRDFRIVGSEVYTSNFTAPTETLTAISGTQILIANGLPYIKDSSGNATPITVLSGGPSIEGAGPHDQLEYTAATHLGSAHFDSNGDYLMAPSGAVTSQNNSADFNFSSGAWTWEAWVYPSSLTSPASPHVFTSRYNGTYRSSFYYNSSASQLTYWSNGSARISGPALNLNQWYHVALSSDGTTTTMWVNGESKGTTTHMQSNYDQTMYVGAAVGSGLEAAGYWNGNITDARVVKGTQVYTSNFTPPAAPLTAVTNTKLLIQNTDGGIIDKSQGQRRIKLIGDVKSSTTQNKFLTSSIKFDDNGDYILVKPAGTLSFGTGDFTVEYWIYYNAIGNYDYIYDGRNTSQTTGSWSIAHGYGGGNATILQWASGSSVILTAASNPSTSQWVHVAFCRSGSTLKLFYDGTENQSATDTTNYSTNLTHSYFGCRHSVEHYLNAYLSDFRVTQGLARYTSNFTAPTAALQG